MGTAMSPQFILLVENDLNLRQSMLLMLQRAGYFTTATDCVCEAMNIIDSGRYQLLIADLDMPDAKNLLLPQVINQYPYLSIIILAGQSSSEEKQENTLVSTQYLVKPVPPERLLDCIEMTLQTSNHSSQ
jgi:two-component system, NtrC family, response regulator HydG